jgi:DNA-binding transcriptional ArsR family regulator
LWISITDLARRKGVKPPTISVRVTRFERDGLLTTRRGRGKIKLVNLAEYDRVAGETTDLLKEQAAAQVRSASLQPESPSAQGDPTFTDAQRKKAQYDAAMRALDYAERTGNVLPINGPAGVADAMVAAGEKIVRIVRTLSGMAPAIAAAASKDGEPGVRSALKALEHDLLTRIAAAMRLIEAHGLSQEAAGACVVELPELETQEP